MDSDFTKLTVGIIGLGLIGGSYAKGLRRLGTGRIIGIDSNEAVLQQALQEKVIDEGRPEPGAVLRQAQVLIFCLPAEAMLRCIRQYAGFFHPQALLTDVSGIKGDTARTIRKILPPGMDFVAGHPMAGREGSGFSRSDADIFRGANYILVPQEENDPVHVRQIRHMAAALGCRHIMTVTPQEHDRMIAYTSSLPHVLATSLVNSCSMNRDTKYFIAGSFRDGTRVADINGALWTQLFLQNKENLLAEIGHFQESLQEFTVLLSQGNARGMEQFLTKAAARRRELLTDGNHTC